MPKDKQEIKQVIVVRRDLGMRKGKIAGQVAHASLACILNYINNTVVVNENEKHIGITVPNNVFSWLYDKNEAPFKKIVVRVDSEKELLAIQEMAENKKINNVLITDAGHTVFKEPTNTVLGLGPDYVSVLNEITGRLTLL